MKKHQNDKLVFIVFPDDSVWVTMDSYSEYSNIPVNILMKRFYSVTSIMNSAVNFEDVQLNDMSYSKNCDILKGMLAGVETMLLSDRLFHTWCLNDLLTDTTARSMLKSKDS